VARSRRRNWKEGKDVTVVDTMNLASQHFHYLLLKDPFADKERLLLLATEAFSHAFGDKEGSDFVVGQDMLDAVSTTVKFFHSD